MEIKTTPNEECRWLGLQTCLSWSVKGAALSGNLGNSSGREDAHGAGAGTGISRAKYLKVSEYTVERIILGLWRE